MRKFISFLTLLVFSTAQAGLPPTNVQGQADASTATKFSFQVPNSQYVNLGGIKALLDTGNPNQLPNANFEHTTFDTSWTTTTVTSAVETSTIYSGKQSAKLTYSSQTGGISQSFTPVSNTSGINYEASCKVNTTMTTIEVCGLSNATSQGCTTVPSTGTWQYVAFPFVGPSNGTSVGVKVDTTASGSGSVYVDDCYVGPARMIGTATVNTPYVDDSANWTVTGCGTVTNLKMFTRRNGDALDAYGTFTNGTTTTTCSLNLPSSITIDTSKLPAVGPGTPVGVMTEVITGTARASFSSDDQHNIVYDGSTNSKLFFAVNDGASVYTKAQMSSSRLPTFMFRIPITQYSDQSIVSMGATPMSWSGYHDNTCSWARTNTAYGDPTADATCSLVERQNRNAGTVVTYTSGNAMPGITWTPNATGRFFVCAAGKWIGGNLAATMDIRLWDGTTVIGEDQTQAIVASDQETFHICGIYNVSTIASTTLSLQTKASAGAVTIQVGSTNTSVVEWSIAQLDIPKPTVFNTGSITSNSSTLGFRAEGANFTCSSSSSIGSQSGTWASAIGNISSGKCSVTVTGFTATPWCPASRTGTAVTRANCHANPTSTTNVDLYCGTDAGAADTSCSCDVVCMGQR